MDRRRPFLRPSPGEIEAAVKEQRERLRKFRIQQVREQSHKEAQRIRNKVEDSRKKCQDDVRSAAVSKWQQDKENRLLQLQEEYEECVQSLGKAHGSAKDQPDSIALLSERAEQNRLKAEKRNKDALKNEKENQIKENKQNNLQINQRKKALHREKIRAKKVANLETPEAFKKKVCQIPKPPPSVKLHEAGTFTTTEYIPRNVLIKKESGSRNINARSLAAQEEDARKRKTESDAQKQDQANKRKELRGAEALRRERIHRQYEDLVARLDHTSKQHLSRYLRGTDLSVHETPAERISDHAALEREMESAIELLMNENNDRDKRKHHETDSAYATDLVADLTDNISAEIINDNGKSDLTSLLTEIRKRREELLRESFVSKSSESVENDELPQNTDITRREPQKDGHVKKIEKRNKIDEHIDRNKEENILPLKDYGTQETYERTEPLSNSIHFKETVPVDLLPERVEIRNPQEENKTERIHTDEQIIRPERIGRENQRDRNIQYDQNLYRYGNSVHSSDTDHNSNYDIDVEYSATAESTLRKKNVNTNEQFNGPERFGRENQQDNQNLYRYDNSVSSQEADHNSNYDVGLEYSAAAESTLRKKNSIIENTGNVTGLTQASSSTEYMSPPNSLPSKKNSSNPSKNPLDEAINNLKKIQEQRLANQRLLDQQNQNIGNVPMVSSTPKPTYSQEIKMEGTGKRPKRKKDKFLAQKSKLLEYYAKKVVDMKQDQLLEHTSDSVDGSHVTVTSLTPLIDNMKRTPKDSLASASFYLSSSNTLSPCSSNYPDIDEIPTRLSKSSSEELSSSNSPFTNSDTNLQIIYESSDYSSDTLSINASSVNNMTPQQSQSINSSSINNLTHQHSLSINPSSIYNLTPYRSLSINDSSVNNITHQQSLSINASSINKVTPHRSRSINDSSINNITPQSSLNIDISSIDSSTPQQPLSSETSSQESTIFIHSSNEMSLKEPSQQARRMEILEKLQELQRIKSELLKQEQMASMNYESEPISTSSVDIDATVPRQRRSSQNFESEASSTSSVDIDATASFQNIDRVTTSIDNVPRQRRVSFRNPTKKELSTINEQETEVSDNIKNIDTSNSYHTPSREFEETFSESSETSHSTKQHLADMHSLLYDQQKYKSGQSNKDDIYKGNENTESLSSSYDVVKQSLPPKDNLVQKNHKSSFMPNTETGQSKTSILPEPFAETIADSSKESQFQTSISTLNLSSSPPTKIASDSREEINTTEKGSAEKNANRTLYLKGGYTPSAIVKSKLVPRCSSLKILDDSANLKSASHQKLCQSMSTMASHQYLGHSVSTMAAPYQSLGHSERTMAATHQKLGHDSVNSTADDSLFTPLVAEDTLIPGFDEENNILQKLQDEKTALAVNPNIPSKSSSNSNSESESVASMPDMADILQRFGMDWAKTMMKRMEKTEQNSSSDSSIHVK